MKKIFFFLIFHSIALVSFAQDGLGYYYNYFDHFYVFDKGQNIELEINPVDNIRIGNDYIAYMNQGGDFRVYYNGLIETLEENLPTEIVPTAYALVYKMNKRLMLYERGKKIELSSWARSFYAADSIVTWQDERSMDVMAYQNGEIKTIESGNSVTAINNGVTGKNIFAYSDMNNEFKIFYNNQVYDTKFSNISNYKCGLNTVAFIDKFNNTFNVFYKGEVKIISEQIPLSYEVADNIVTYIDFNSSFMAYYMGTSVQIEPYAPTVHNTRDNIIEYYYEPDLKIIYDGKRCPIEKYISDQSILLGPNSALYLDDNKRPKYFYKGKTYDNIVIEQVSEMQLIRDLPVFKYGINTTAFFYDGKLYEFETSKKLR